MRSTNGTIGRLCPAGGLEGERRSGYDSAMARSDHTEIRMRIVIERPVAGVRHSLQAKDDGPLDPKTSLAGEPLAFDFPVRIAAGPKFFGDQVRREGPVRRFVYIRIGQMAGDALSPWTRRMKIDIHDIPQDLLDRAAQGGGVLELRVDGTGKDGTPACATLPVTSREIL
jgi:hypothetical protein